MNESNPAVNVGQNSIDAQAVFHLAAEGMGPTQIAEQLGVGKDTFDSALASSPEIREAWEAGSNLLLEQIENRIVGLIWSEATSPRDKIAAYQAWARNNRATTKRLAKAKAEAIAEMTPEQIRAELDQMMRRNPTAARFARLEPLDVDPATDPPQTT